VFHSSSLGLNNIGKRRQVIIAIGLTHGESTLSVVSRLDRDRPIVARPSGPARMKIAPAFTTQQNQQKPTKNMPTIGLVTLSVPCDYRPAERSC
jgi:hypothetical protein